MSELWEWPYEPELDRWNIARVKIPEDIRYYVRPGYRVSLMCPDGTVLNGSVVAHNDHYARVKVEEVKE